MAIAYRSGNSGGNGTGTDVVVTAPSGLTDNDILVAVLYHEAGTWTLPAGWAYLITDVKCNSFNAWVSVAWKRASSEGASYTFQLDTSTWRVVSVGAFSGATTSGNPFDASQSSNAPNLTAITALSITTGSDNEVAIILTGNVNGDDPTAGSTGYSAGQMLGGCGMFYKTWATAGATGDQALGRTAGSSGDNVAHHVALIPDTGIADLAISVSESVTLTESVSAFIQNYISPSITYFGSSSNPADNPAATNTADPTTVIPPSSMQSGDLVIMVAQSRATTGTIAISNAGGQSWTSLTQHNATTCRRMIFWCVFNGTWSANPSVSMGGTTCNTVVMHVFRPKNGGTWSADVAVANATYTAPTTPFTVSITGITVGDNAVAVACFHSVDDNVWGGISGSTWMDLGTPQYRNTSGSDQSSTYAYFLGTSIATGNVTKNQTSLGGDAGATSILSWKLFTDRETYVSEDVSITEDVTVSIESSGPSPDNVSVSDTVTISEDVSAFVTPVPLNVSVSDTVTIAETKSVQVGGSTSVRNVLIGQGYSDVTPQQIVRTKADIAYAVAQNCDVYPDFTTNGLDQTIRVFKADQSGVPVSFTRKDTANEPSASVGCSCAIDASDIIHIAWSARSSSTTTAYLRYAQFDPSTDTWGSVTTIASNLSYDDIGQGDENTAIAIDENGKVHIVYLSTNGSGTLNNRRIWYVNNVSGSWSSPVQLDSGVTYTGNQKCWHPGIAFGPTGWIFATFQRGSFNGDSDGTIYCNVYESGSWSGARAISGAGTTHVGIDQGTPVVITQDGRVHTTYIGVLPNQYVVYAYSDNKGVSWNTNNPGSGTWQTHDPQILLGKNNRFRIMGHDPDPGPYNLRYYEGDGGSAAWDTNVNYATGDFDCSVSKRWAQYFNTRPQTVEVVYWQTSYPNDLYYSADFFGDDPSVSDTVTITEGVTVSVSAPSVSDLNVSVVDTVTISETYATYFEFDVSVSDTVTLSESTTMLLESNISVTETVTVSESVTMLLESFVSVQETITLSESVGLIPELAINVQDTVTLGESANVYFEFDVSVQENITVSEGVGVAIASATDILVGVSESITVSEIYETYVTTEISVSDTVTLSESVTTEIVIEVSVSDTVTVTESVGVEVIVEVSVSELVTISETYAVSAPAAGATDIVVSESVTISESVSMITSDDLMSVSDGITIAEDVSVAIESVPDMSISVSDGVTLSESVALIYDLFASCSDVVTLSEQIGVVVQNALDANISVSDSVSLSESVSMQIDILILVAEIITISESVALSSPLPPDFAISVYDSITVGEAFNVAYTGQVIAIIALTVAPRKTMYQTRLRSQSSYVIDRDSIMYVRLRSSSGNLHKRLTILKVRGK